MDGTINVCLDEATYSFELVRGSEHWNQKLCFFSAEGGEISFVLPCFRPIRNKKGMSRAPVTQGSRDKDHLEVGWGSRLVGNGFRLRSELGPSLL